MPFPITSIFTITAKYIAWSTSSAGYKVNPVFLWVPTTFSINDGELVHDKYPTKQQYMQFNLHFLPSLESQK